MTPTTKTSLEPAVAAMLLKKLGKDYKRQTVVRALAMDMPFTLNDTHGDPGDYLVLDDKGGMSVMTAADFRVMFGVARRGRKRKAPPTLPPAPLSDLTLTPTANPGPFKYVIAGDQAYTIGEGNDPDHGHNPTDR